MSEALLESNYALINDINIHYVSASPKKADDNDITTLVFLHGFPEYWRTWQAQLDYFSKKHHVIAPDLPGYNLSDKPDDISFYQIPHLIEFIAKFIATVSPTEKVHLVAHDWGGALAWPLAAFYPQYIDKLIILNAAHPSTFTREMINNQIQRDKSTYIHELISEHAAQLLAKNNYQYLREKMLMTANDNPFNEKSLNDYMQAWQQPNAVEGMLNYYRAMPQLASPTQSLANNTNNSNVQVTETNKMRIPNIRIHAPTLILWGENDQAFVNENLNNIKDYVPYCKIIRFSDTSHWIMHEKSPEINSAIAHFIK